MGQLRKSDSAASKEERPKSQQKNTEKTFLSLAAVQCGAGRLNASPKGVSYRAGEAGTVASPLAPWMRGTGDNPL